MDEMKIIIEPLTEYYKKCLKKLSEQEKGESVKIMDKKIKNSSKKNFPKIKIRIFISK